MLREQLNDLIAEPIMSDSKTGQIAFDFDDENDKTAANERKYNNALAQAEIKRDNAAKLYGTAEMAGDAFSLNAQFTKGIDFQNYVIEHKSLTEEMIASEDKIKKATKETAGELVQLYYELRMLKREQINALQNALDDNKTLSPADIIEIKKEIHDLELSYSTLGKAQEKFAKIKDSGSVGKQSKILTKEEALASGDALSQ